MDQIFIVASVCHPLPNPLVIDKMIAVAEDKGIEPIVVLSKADLGDWSPWQALYEAAGIRFVAVSAVTGQGVAEIQELLRGKLSAFTGNSGVGKSTLLNGLEEGYALETGEISQKLGRGRHTTRQVELLKLSRRRLCGGYPWVFHCGYRTV